MRVVRLAICGEFIKTQTLNDKKIANHLSSELNLTPAQEKIYSMEIWK